jgi:hypothetical protein
MEDRGLRLRGLAEEVVRKRRGGRRLMSTVWARDRSRREGEENELGTALWLEGGIGSVSGLRKRQRRRLSRGMGQEGRRWRRRG